MEDVADLALDHPHRLLRSAGQIPSILFPVLPCENGMLLILFQNLFHQCVQNRLLALEMAVKGCLADAHRIDDLGNGRSLKALDGK